MIIFQNNEGEYSKNWDKIRKKVLKRDNYRCQECGEEDLKLHVHHKVPKSRGGSDDLDNLVTLCKFCHSYKHPIRVRLKKAIRKNKTINIVYKNRNGYTSKKKIDPYDIVYQNNMEILVGYDHDVDEKRFFRPKRLKRINFTSLVFSPPSNFDAESYVEDNFLFPGEEKKKKESKCFIATAAYGTPYAEEIDVLRDFRDDVLLEKVLGEILVAIYYRYSPPIADIITKNEKFREIVKDYFVSPLVNIFKII